MQLIPIRPSKGLAADLPAWEVGNDFWTQGDNVVFRDAFAERVAGHADVHATLQDAIRSLMCMEVSGTNSWLYNGDTKMYVVQGTTHTDLTPGGGITGTTDLNQWTVGVLNGIPFANNGVDTPMYWDLNLANNFAELTGWESGDIAYSMRAFKYFLLAIGLTSTSGSPQPDVVKWSKSASAGAIPSTWAASASNDAGAIPCSETNGKLIDGAILGGSFVLYKQHAAHILDWIGGNDVMEARPILQNVGILSRNCVAGYRGAHYLLSDGDFLRFDGADPRSVIDARMRRFLFNQLDQSNYEAAFVHPFPKRNEIWVCIPSSGNTYCDLALIYNVAKDSWGVRELPLVSCAALGFVTDDTPSSIWSAQTNPWSDYAGIKWGEIGAAGLSERSLVLGKPDDATATNSQMLEVDNGTDFDGTEISAKVAKHSMPLGNPYQVKTVTSVFPRVNAPAGTELLVRIGTQMDVSEAISWSAQRTYTVGTDDRADIIATGRFISVEVSSLGGQVWQLSGVDLKLREGGFA